MELPNRAVAPGPAVGKERKRGRGAPSVSSSRGYLRADTSLHRPASPCSRPRTNLSRTSWRSNTSGSCKALPPGTGGRSSAPRHRLRPHGFLLRPSTAAVLRPALVARRLPWGYSCLHQLETAPVPRSSPSSRVLKPGATRDRTFAPLPVTLPMAAAPYPTPDLRASQAVTAGLMPRNLTRACSGLAALAADAGG